ncbi:uncharacterized protein LOC108091369 [Drosophila ficusphila]|uniref:uncharacterized protein LOC108091369 n=1 Tax=Drosophila ficusphila TaxID=30025 RepID=UPI0007E70985|nr:uncharacterized protein LOC108091369 [Drosophila ficusphila]
MSTRTCAYKDCEYYYDIHDNALTKGRTLFAFPKQNERAKIWHKNGRVHPKIPQNQLFMCSLHFDRKFISSSKNRTLLVGEAVPYPYQERDSEPEEELQQVASTSQERYFINLSDDELSINVDTTSKQNTLDKELDFELEAPLAKRPKSTVAAPSVKDTPPEAPSLAAEPSSIKLDLIEAIDISEVSVFNFKGQEYVQMSMEYYLNEKRKLVELLKDYKAALRSIKSHVSQLDL